MDSRRKDNIAADFHRTLHDAQDLFQTSRWERPQEHADFLTEPSCILNLLAGGNAAKLNMDVRSLIRESIPDLIRTPQTWSATNYTIFPDELLATLKATFLIRHPALMFPSQARAFPNILKIKGNLATEQADSIHTLRSARLLYELYKDVIFVESHSIDDSRQWPVILNSAEALSDPELMKKYCNQVGFDKNKLKMSWDRFEDDLDGKNASVMNVTLDASREILKEKVVITVNINMKVSK